MAKNYSFNPAIRGVAGLWARPRRIVGGDPGVFENQKENVGKEASRALLAEMAGFSLGGFGPPQTRLEMGAYDRERGRPTLRQFGTEKDTLWGVCLRVPIGNRIAQSSDALRWGILNTEKTGRWLYQIGRMFSHTHEAYDALTLAGGIRNAGGASGNSRQVCLRGQTARQISRIVFRDRATPRTPRGNFDCPTYT